MYRSMQTGAARRSVLRNLKRQERRQARVIRALEQRVREAEQGLDRLRRACHGRAAIRPSRPHLSRPWILFVCACVVGILALVRFPALRAILILLVAMLAGFLGVLLALAACALALGVVVCLCRRPLRASAILIPLRAMLPDLVGGSGPTPQSLLAAREATLRDLQAALATERAALAALRQRLLDYAEARLGTRG